jgi:hypothetical protein
MRIISLVLLAACADAPTDPADDTDVAADDTDVIADDTDVMADDTDAADDTDVASDDTDVEEVITPHDCLDNHGIHGLSSRWTYTWKNSSRTGARVATVTAYDNERNTATRRIQSNWTDAAATFSETRVVNYRCDADFLYILSQTVDSTLDLAVVDPTVTSDSFTYDVPIRVQSNESHAPPTPTIWTRTTQGTRTDAVGGTSDFDTEVMCWLVETDVLGYSPWTPDHYQCGSPPVFPDPEPTITEEYRWEEGIGVVNDWDTRLTEHLQ